MLKTIVVHHQNIGSAYVLMVEAIVLNKKTQVFLRRTYVFTLKTIVVHKKTQVQPMFAIVLNRKTQVFLRNSTIEPPLPLRSCLPRPLARKIEQPLLQASQKSAAGCGLHRLQQDRRYSLHSKAQPRGEQQRPAVEEALLAQLSLSLGFPQEYLCFYVKNYSCVSYV